MSNRQRPLRRATDRQTALRDRSVANRRVIVAALAIAAVIVGAFAWHRAGGPPVRDGAPSWSPDGGRIVYYAEQPDGQADLFVMNADGSRPQRLTETTADEGGPAFSPDGTRIAFDTDRDGNFEIYVMNANGSNLRRVTTHAGRDVAPAWSPDSSSIVFMSDRDRPEFDLYRIEPDGTGLERLTGQGSNWFPQFAPVDPPRLALHVRRDVHVLDVATRTLMRLTTEPRDGMYPTWSPDGTKIAFMSARNGPTEIFTMNADGTGQELLVSMTSGSAIDPRWSPTGRHIVFVHVPEGTPEADQRHDQERAIYVVEVATRRLMRLSR